VEKYLEYGSKICVTPRYHCSAIPVEPCLGNR